MEKTYVMIKPDAVQRNLIGEIISCFEKKGLTLVAMKFLRLSQEQAQAHYQEHVGKKFYDGLISFITSGPVVAMVWEGPGVIQSVRRLMGATDPAQAEPGTIRGDMGTSISRNVVHGSDSRAAAEREINLFFNDSELPG